MVEAHLSSVQLLHLLCTVPVHVVKDALNQLDEQGEVIPSLPVNHQDTLIRGSFRYILDFGQTDLLNKLSNHQ